MTEYILMAAFAFWFAELSTIPQIMLAFTTKTRLRPFDCAKCMGLWLALTYSIAVQLPWYESVLYAGVTSLIAICFSRLYYKILS